MPHPLPPDIILLICEELGNQHAFGTLFNAALSNKQIAASALLWMYRVHTTSSIRAADSTDDAIPKAGTTSDTVMKWALQWRSIILSSLGKTTYPYCLYIRSLDLTNLKELFEDPVFIKNSLYDQFFKGDLNFLVKTQGTVTRRPRLKTSSVTLVDKVGELICKYTGESAERNGGTAALEEVSGEIQKESLPKWIRWLPRLRSLTLWTGDILDGSVADVIKYHCPDFDSLTLLFCMGSRVDANLFSFFGGLRSNSLRALLVHNHHDAGPQTFLSLNNHRASLKQLTLGSLKEPALKSLSLLKGCTAIETLDLEDLTGSIDLEATENDTFLEIIAWLTSCKQLKSICLKKFVNGPRILTSVCLEHSIKLNSLSLETYNLSGNQEFHRALAQHTSLTSVELRGDAEDSFRDDIDTLVECLCKLKNLKYLDILGISDFFKTSEIQLLAMHLSKLEDLRVGGYDVTDEVWSAISTLPDLRSLYFYAVTSFSYDGIVNYISSLRSTNAGLQLYVMCADAKCDLSQEQVNAIKEAIAEQVDGKFEFVLYREAGSDFSSDSD